jgi:DNA mismatch endonuclease (patch repair protein)
MDNLTPEQRSKTMAKIRSKDTAAELALRRALWQLGVRYRKHYQKVPGVPDIALPGKKIAVFVDGEFWHGFQWDSRKEAIKSNRAYWIPKIERNIARDRAIEKDLQSAGWAVLRFWSREVLLDPIGCAKKVVDVSLVSRLD